MTRECLPHANIPLPTFTFALAISHSLCLRLAREFGLLLTASLSVLRLLVNPVVSFVPLCAKQLAVSSTNLSVT